MITQDKAKSETVVVPPMSFYFVSLLVIAFFFLALDFIYRNVSILNGLSPLTIAANVINAVVFAYLVSLVLTPVMWILEYAASSLGAAVVATIPTTGNQQDKNSKIQESLQPGNSRYTALFSIFLMFMLLAYINGLYLKFFVMSKSNINVTTVHTYLQIPIFVFLGLAVLAFIVNRKHTFNYASLEKPFRKAFKPLVTVGLVCLVLSMGIFTINAFIPRKGAAANVSLTEEQKKQPNIILITFDSLNAKHMSLYGYERDTTPNLKKLANEFHVFERFRCNVNYTSAALMCYFGRYPRAPLKTDFSLFTFLGENGYKTRSFVTSRYYDRELYRGITHTTNILAFEKTGIARLLYKGDNRKNFIWLTNILSENHRFFNLFYLIDQRSMSIRFGDPYPLPVYFDYAVDQLKNEPLPAFVWVHAFDPHFPYLVPDDFKDYFGNVTGTYNWTITSKTVNSTLLTDRYDTSIRYVDREIGRFIEKLKKEGLYDNTIIILSADHGESFGDMADGYENKVLFIHGNSSFNDEIARIPLLIHLPGLQDGKRVQTFAEPVDIAPTLCELLGIRKGDRMEGESLVPYMNNPERMSRKVKISLPLPLFYRNLQDRRYHIWGPEDTVEVFWDRYKIGWRQSYPPPRGSYGRNKVDKFYFTFVYDVLKDPHQTDNLLNKPETKGLLAWIYNHPLVKYYRSADVK